MASALRARELIIGLTPFEEPNARLTVAVERAGGLGVLDLGRDPEAARVALDDVCRWWPDRTFGVRVPSGCPLTPADLPDRVDTVLLACGSPWKPSCALASGPAGSRRRVLAEVTSVAEAHAAVQAGAHGLVVRGCEAGGQAGETTTFVLLQQLMADGCGVTVPLWAAGGIGLHTAAAAVTGGATGVVLDTQLALVAEMELPAEVASAIRSMDGSETAVVGGHRVYVRPDLPVARLVGDDVAPGWIAARLGARNLREQFLPVGQEACLASLFARRHVTAGGVIQAVRAAITEHLDAAVESEPLAPGARLATAHGLRVPVAQGPMTHVSDRAAFAAAVAEAGGLPFLALSLLSGEKTRALLTETAALLGDRPWGAGILGFVPAEVREPQLEAILDLRPPYALIAGGRPSQAKELETAGIGTFLHVPSPGLLDQFLAQGSRRFVFEGRECGGHVGPRSSFALWETQVEHLLAFGARTAGAGEHFFDDLHVLFAGGVHDERSAAMVAALGAPLAERGAGVGVLMGTAYLFTDAAVAAGAILPEFQRAALECEHTVLLETSPGHSTRCVDSAYVRTFLDTKHRLIADGVGQKEMWAELEQLNLGRLRIASKGLRRQGERILPVGEDAQHDDGMFMIGDVAALRSATTTIDAVHAQVSDGATGMLAARAAELGLTAGPAATAVDAEPLDVAIVGMAGVFAQAGDTARFWSHVVAGVDAITEVPADRWNPEHYYDPGAAGRAGGRKTPSKWGGFLPNVPFDALAYGIPPNSLSGIEPVQLLALEAAARALRDAGYRVTGSGSGAGSGARGEGEGEGSPGREFDRTRTSVVFGTESGTDLSVAYGFRSFFPSYFGQLPPVLDEHLPTLSEDSFPGVLGNVVAGRIANRLDLGGANFTVDAACAASLAALDAACKELRSGTSDMVLCGGADTHNSIYDYLLFASVGALAASGRCRTFDSAADGIALGEGVGCVVLKRLADAERDGDRIYAVVKGMAGSSDGRSLGLTAPRLEGQRLAMDRAYRMAGVSPAQVGLVEAHGTGTVVGDRTELASLTTLFTEAGATAGSCALGSVKSQIGHTKCAAGVASLIKTARALYTGVRPPTGHLRTPNAYWEAESSPFFFDAASRPWLASPAERIAGVSSFGFGGTNFHAVLAGYGGAPEPAHGLDEWPAELFCFRGADRTAALREMDRLAGLIAANDAAGRPWRLRDLARTVSVDGAGSERRMQVALVAGDLDELAARLERARTLTPDPGAGVFVAAEPEAGVPETDPGADARTGKVAFLFPGQGSQRVGMLADLFVAFPRLRRLLRMGERWYPAMFPPAAFTPEETARQRATLTDTRIAQPALGVAGMAMYRLLTSIGVRPAVVAGHSYGELVALAAAGAIPEDELLALSQARGEAILSAALSATPSGGEPDPGAMAAVTASAERIQEILTGDAACAAVVVANHNAPEQTVVSGPTPAIEAALTRLAEHGLTATRLQVACAFHSPVVAAAQTRLAEELGLRGIAAPGLPVWSNTTAEPYPAEPEAVRALLARQVGEPVRFVEQIEAMYAAGVRVFVEAGPGRVLTQLVGKILAGRPYTAVACDVPGEHGVRRLLLALAELAAAGVPVDVEPLFRGRDAGAVSAADVPRRAGWIVNGHLVRTSADGRCLPGGLRPATELGTLPVTTLTGPATVDGAGRDTAVLEFLRSTRELMAAQRDVMLGYLGTTTPAPSVLTSAPATAGAADTISGTSGNGQAGPQAGSQAGPKEPLTPERALAVVRTIVSERTGYPEDMLDADLDLEADLSIDSIKRTEILGALRERVAASGSNGAGAVDESAIEQLARLKTLRAIVEWIVARVLGPQDGAQQAPPAAGTPQMAATPPMEAVPDGSGPDGSVPIGVASNGSASNGSAASPEQPAPAAGPSGAPQRYVVQAAPLPALETVTGPDGSGEGAALDGRRVVIVEAGMGVDLELAVLLEQRGAQVRMVSPEGDSHRMALRTDADVVVYLAALTPEGLPVLPHAFAALREAVLGGTRQLLVATGLGGRFGRGRQASGATGAGLGLHGLVRTIAREFPELVVRAVDVDPKDEPERIATHLLAELLDTDPHSPVTVGYRDGERATLRLAEAPLQVASVNGGVTATTATALGLGPDSVVLLTGGARGITAEAAIGLARAGGCHIELVGRTPPPAGEEDPATAQAADRVALRRAVIEQGIRVPAEVETVTARLLAEREIRATLTELGRHAASVRYHVADVRDPEAVRAVVTDVYARHGRLDGVVHGAGVLDDKLLLDKTPEGFTRVFTTKVDGARALAEAVHDDLGFLVLFGSVVGVCGNRGQADYAAANDALDTLAHQWAQRFPGRVVSVDWGPWAPAAGGMVSAELQREYARRGIGMIDHDAGVACLLRELAHGDRRDAQVVYLCGSPEAFGADGQIPAGRGQADG